MSVQRIDIDRKHTHGWQARAESTLKRKARGMKRGEV